MIKRIVVLLLTIGLVFPFPIFSAVIGEFAVVTGDVTVKRAGKVMTPKAKDKVETLDFIQTGKNSNARVVLSDDTAMALGPNSRLEMKQFAVQGGKTTGLFSVPEGLVQTKVAKALGPGSRFEIQTPTAIAGVRGTAWLTLVELATQGVQGVVVSQSSFFSLSQAISVASTAFPGQVATVVAGNFTVVAAGALPTAVASFSAATVASLTATLGSAAIPGVAGAAGAGVVGTAGTTAAGTAGTAAGTATIAGIGVGTIAVTAVIGAVIVAAVVASNSKTDTTATHSTTSSHHH